MPDDIRDQLPATFSALKSGAPAIGIVPTTVDEVWRLAVIFTHAGLAPDSYKGKDEEETRSKICIGIMRGLELGVGPATALANIAIINNRASIWGDLAVALIQRAGKMEWIRHRYEGEAGTDARVCHVEAKRVGHAEIYHASFSMKDAQRAGLLGKGTWRSYPDRMVYNRARAFVLRDGFADCLAGLSIAEESMDLPAPDKGPVDTSFLSDPPAIEHKPEIPIQQPASPAAHDGTTVAQAQAVGPGGDAAIEKSRFGPSPSGAAPESDATPLPPASDQAAEQHSPRGGAAGSGAGGVSAGPAATPEGKPLHQQIIEAIGQHKTARDIDALLQKFDDSISAMDDADREAISQAASKRRGQLARKA